MLKKSFNRLNNLAASNKNLEDLNSIFNIIDELNQILETLLPKNLCKYCHVGAIDPDKELIVLFVSEQQVYYTIHNLANQILQHFASHNFHFNSILIKTRQYRKQAQPIKMKALEPKIKNKLQEFANSIDKPDLIKENITIDNLEIDL